MAKEIERKFLVNNNSYLTLATSAIEIRQGYISRQREATVRIRIAGDRAWLTLKGPNEGAVRDEWEYNIPVVDAEEMLRQLAHPPVLFKTRYIVPFEGFRWEVDIFHGELEGLCIAEVELPDAGTSVPLPPFIGHEVTGNPAYYNSNLISPPAES